MVHFTQCLKSNLIKLRTNTKSMCSVNYSQLAVENFFLVYMYSNFLFTYACVAVTPHIILKSNASNLSRKHISLVTSRKNETRTTGQRASAMTRRVISFTPLANGFKRDV